MRNSWVLISVLTEVPAGLLSSFSRKLEAFVLKRTIIGFTSSRIHNSWPSHRTLYPADWWKDRACRQGITVSILGQITIFFPMPPHVLSDFVVSPTPSPGCGWSVTDFWGWDAQEERLGCPDENDGEMKGESGVSGGGLDPSKRSYIQNNTASHPRKLQNSFPPSWEPQTSHRRKVQYWTIHLSPMAYM